MDEDGKPTDNNIFNGNLLVEARLRISSQTSILMSQVYDLLDFHSTVIFSNSCLSLSSHLRLEIDIVYLGYYHVAAGALVSCARTLEDAKNQWILSELVGEAFEY